jgi:hypothetical protein
MKRMAPKHSKVASSLVEDASNLLIDQLLLKGLLVLVFPHKQQQFLGWWWLEKILLVLNVVEKYYYNGFLTIPLLSNKKLRTIYNL